MGTRKLVECLVVDTTAFIQNAALHEVAETIVTCQEVVDEITSQRQLRRLVVLPYDLVVKNVYSENIKVVTDFSKKTGDYPSLSATDIKVMALTYQMEKEKVGSDHIRTEPILKRPVLDLERPPQEINPDITGFFLPGKHPESDEKPNNNATDKKECEDDNEKNFDNQTKIRDKDLDSDLDQNISTNQITDESLAAKFKTLNCDENDLKPETNEEDILVSVKGESNHCDDDKFLDEDSNEEEDDDNDVGWITPSNVNQAKKQVNSQLMEEKHVAVACMTTDFAMQNVLRQMNLNVSALDGRVIKQLRTYILRCYACFKTTSIMTKKFCPKCGNNTLKKVAVSVDDKGEMRIHINPRKPLTGRGKKFSLPTIKGGKHPNNPRLVEDQPMADNRPSRLARTKNNPLDDDYIAGFSPFIMRDINSKSAQLGIRPGSEFKHWMKKNPNEARRKRK